MGKVSALSRFFFVLSLAYLVLGYVYHIWPFALIAWGFLWWAAMIQDRKNRKPKS